MTVITNLLLKGPTFPEPLQTPEDLKKLKEKVDVQESLGYVMEAITLTRHTLEGKCPLIGFSGAPVSIKCLLFEAYRGLIGY